jgi:hypothetical protein
LRPSRPARAARRPRRSLSPGARLNGAVRLPPSVSSQPFSTGYAPNGAVREVFGPLGSRHSSDGQGLVRGEIYPRPLAGEGDKRSEPGEGGRFLRAPIVAGSRSPPHRRPLCRFLRGEKEEPARTHGPTPRTESGEESPAPDELNGAVRLPSFPSSQPFSMGYAPNGAVRERRPLPSGAISPPLSRRANAGCRACVIAHAGERFHRKPRQSKPDAS